MTRPVIEDVLLDEPGPPTGIVGIGVTVGAYAREELDPPTTGTQAFDTQV